MFFLKVSSELLSSHPGSVEGLTIKGLTHRAEKEHQQAEQWYVFIVFSQFPSTYCTL